jgi:hypothetical protein
MRDAKKRTHTFVVIRANSRSFDCALARPQKMRTKNPGERSAQDDADLGF